MERAVSALTLAKVLRLGNAMKLTHILLVPVVASLLSLSWLVRHVDAKDGVPFVATFRQAQTAGIDGREWDQSFPSATTVDAVHRAVLIRFPFTAERIKVALDLGLTIERVEIVLEFDGTEIVPNGYLSRPHLGKEKWEERPPQWSIVAWPLRRPWAVSNERGPTFNAYINGFGYWARYGASDTNTDRFPTRFGPFELSHVAREAKIDVTAVFADPIYGMDLGTRLRLIEENGLLLKKLETYDARYRETSDPYEWAVPTGGHGLRFKNPRMVVTFRHNTDREVLPPPLYLPTSTDIASLASSLERSDRREKPTAVMPTPEEFEELSRNFALRRPPGMAEWQFDRVTELYRIGGGRVTDWIKAVNSGNRLEYERLIREILATPPRYWKGWSVQDDLLVWYLYRDLLPPPVQDHIRAYWEAWLMPDIPTREMFHPQSKEARDYWRKTKDWRGRTSFFRAGFNYAASTQNFNHTAAMGALLGGNIIGSEYAMADGRHGLEHLLMRLWSTLDGSTQEMLDHYYFSITLSAQKMIADFAPTTLDRLMGRIILDRSVELLATAYHPGLRRFINASGRARLSGVLVEQDGIYGALHTLSKRGALNYLNEPLTARVNGMPIWGHDFPPGRVALQSQPSNWAPSWMTDVIDEKSFPFQETSAETTRGNFNPPLWRRTYLGRHYGLASQDIKGGTVDVMAQWSHKSEPATSMEDIGTLTLRYAINEPDMASTKGGTMPYAGGIVTYQYENRAIVLGKPRTEKERIVALAGDEGLRSLSTVVALWNFRKNLGWKLFVDGQPINRLPVSVKAGQVITIKDGVSYIGIIPLPATDLGRKDEVVIGFGGGGKSERYAAPIEPALLIRSYNLQQDHPVSLDDIKLPTISTATYGGFIIEMGDVTEYGDFESFSKKMQTSAVSTRWEPRRKLLNVTYRSDQDVMEVGFATDFRQSDVHFGVLPGEHTKALPYRKFNGTWPYLPNGLNRDTTFSQQGTTGRLEKNGAILTIEEGRKGYLQSDPSSGNYVGYNLLPDPTDWSFSVPGGVTFRANGKVGLLRLAAQPDENRVWIDHSAKLDQNGPEMATSMLAFGLERPPEVYLNGERIQRSLGKTIFGGKAAYVVPLTMH